jgi:hypothetical protein
MITVGDIRKAIEGMPDDAPALVQRPYAGAEGALGAPASYTQIISITKGSEAIFLLAEK